MTHSFFHGLVRVEENKPLAKNTFLIRLASPDIAGAIRPGQFLMLRLHGGSDPLLARPFALYDTVLDSQGKPVALDVVYLVVGKMTTLLQHVCAGDKIEAWGPLGNGFPMLQDVDNVGLVAGGIGQTPFLAYTRELLGERGYAGNAKKRAASRVSLFYGVRNAALAAGMTDFEQAGATVHVATDDGSLGFHGFVTQLLDQQPRPQHLIGCGPEPMLHALRTLAMKWNTPCHLSLETPMACGVGICFSCVTPVKTDEGWDYRRVCIDGPVFDAATLAWD